MAKITFGTANGRKLNKHHIPITSIGTFAVNGKQVTGCIPLSRGDKVKGNYSQFSRLAPLVAPTFGSFSIKTAAFLYLRTLFGAVIVLGLVVVLIRLFLMLL